MLEHSGDICRVPNFWIAVFSVCAGLEASMMGCNASPNVQSAPRRSPCVTCARAMSICVSIKAIISLLASAGVCVASRIACRYVGPLIEVLSSRFLLERMRISISRRGRRSLKGKVSILSCASGLHSPNGSALFKGSLLT